MARLILNIGYSTQLEITPKLLAELEKCNAYERHWVGNPKYQSIETVLEVSYVPEVEFQYKEPEPDPGSDLTTE